MNYIDIKTIILATLICLVTGPLTALVETIMDFTININLNAPLFSYILSGFSPQIVGGFYIATQKIKEKYLVCLLVGLAYSIIQKLFSHFIFLTYIGETQLGLLTIINHSILSMILIVGAYALFSQLLKKEIV